MSTNTRDWMAADTPKEATAISVDGMTLPLGEIVTGRAFVTGKSGSGKSNTVGVVVERLLERGVPVFLIDTDGEYKGLQEEFTILHAGVHAACDVQITVDDAPTIAETAVDEHLPIILDLSGADSDTCEELVAEMVQRLFDQQQTVRHPMLLVVEECHTFLPQRGTTDATGPLSTVAKRGRKHGIGICGTSQRPASVDKAFLTQADWQVWHRLTWKNDTSVVATHLDTTYAERIEDLADGEAFVVRDHDDAPQRIQWPRKQTPDRGDTPSIDRALNSTPARIEPTIYDAFTEADDEESERPTDERPPATQTENESANGALIATYRVQAGQNNQTGCVQIGKPVTEYLGVEASASVSITPSTANGRTALVVAPGRDGRYVYTAYERDGRYVGVSIGIRAMRALGAKPGAQLRVEEYNEESVRVVVTDEEDE